MKRLTLFFLALSLIGLLGACSPHDGDDLDAKGLALSAEKFEWGTAVRSQTLTVNTYASWTIESNVGWCEPRKKSGLGKTELSLWVSPNITHEARSGQLTVRSAGQTKTVSISQPAFPEGVQHSYVVPVVYHVFYKNQNDTTQNISASWLPRITDGVNKLYRDNEAHVQFELAEYDDDGNRLDEPGVIRHRVTFDDYDPMDFLDPDNDDNSRFASYMLNLQRNINIFIFRFSDEQTMGLSDLAVAPSNHELDSLLTLDWMNDKTHVDFPYGCCINSQYIYETQEDGYYNTLYSVATVAHELGHYLGLLHSFSEHECLDDDACSDTPRCDYNAYVEEVSRRLQKIMDAGKQPTLRELAQRVSCDDGSTYTADNIMDYAYCYSDKLSQQQKERIRHVLNYCPTLPGPKLDSPASTRAAQAHWQRPRIVVCPAAPSFATTK